MIVSIGKKGQMQNETIAFIISICIIVIGVFVWLGVKGQGPLHALETFMPNLEKPKVEFPTKLEGLIKYDLVNDNLQYYKDVQFEEPTALADGSKAFFINGNVLKYNEVLSKVKNYYLDNEATNTNRVMDKNFVTSRGEPINSIEITPFGSVILEVGSAYESPNPKSNSDKYMIKIDGSIYLYDGTDYKIVSNSADKYYSGIISYAVKWRDSVLSKPITLRVYNANGQSIGDVCKEYSAPVMKVSSLSGAGFDLNADLSKASYIGECK